MKLEEIRKQIDAIDIQIVTLLARRFALVKKSALAKKQNGRPISDKNRENEVLQNVSKQATNVKENQFLIKLYKFIIKESLQIQQKSYGN